MDSLKIIPRSLCLFALLALASVSVRAQAPADLDLFESIEDTLAGEPQSWTFNGYIGEAVSIRVEALSGDLDPMLTIYDRNGAVLLSNDDYDYPASRDALLESITLPELGTYRATVSAFNGTSGNYRITLLPGYGDLSRENEFDSGTGWTATSEAGFMQVGDSELQLTLTQPSETAVVYNSGEETLADFYAQADITGITGNGWAVGIVARLQSDGSHYRYLVNERGEWRFSLVTQDGEQVIDDWERHPAIRAGERAFTLGIQATGVGFDLIYNRVVVGRVNNDELSESGQIGLAVDNISNVGEISARFDSLRVTTPVQTEAGKLIPQQVYIAPANSMAIELQRRRVVPSGGEIVLNVAESFTEYGRPGVNMLPLASSLRFTNLAIGTTVYADSNVGSPSGCGLVIRSQDTTNYILAYIDGRGGYGVSERSGDTFTPGLYAESANWQPAAPHHLLVIADDNTLHYYVDGRYVGTMETTLTEGGIGNAVVNFEPVYTSCSFVNTWVYRWQ